MRRRHIIILAAIVFIIVFIVIAIMSRMKQDQKPEARKASLTYVHTDIARIENHDILIKGNGRLGSSRNVTLIAEVQGELLPGSVNLKSGSRFRKGQFLFGIDDKEARLKMQARKSGFLTMLATAST